MSATVVKPFGFATGDGEGSRCGIRTRIALQNPVAQVVVAILWGHGPFAIPGQGGMLIGYARVSTQETREQSSEKRRRTPLTTFWAAETQLGEPPHCVRSRLRRMQAPQRSSETPRLACKIAPICLIPWPLCRWPIVQPRFARYHAEVELVENSFFLIHYSHQSSHLPGHSPRCVASAPFSRSFSEQYGDAVPRAAPV